MIKLNHLTIPVGTYSRSRDWYIRNLGLKLEFEVAERKTVALLRHLSKVTGLCL
jgi:catechol 2,3-dioxygenase-like lactoylglutathione lyase family enzyme